MKAIFYNRDFTSQVPLSHLRIYIERYSHNMNGGPDTAYIKIETSGDNWELTKLLRSPVEIYDGDGRLNWWGYVNRINVPSGDIAVGLGLDNMSNYVAANYSLMDAGESAPTGNVLSAYVYDEASVLEYGRKEKVLNVSNATAAQAEQARDTYLASNKFAPPEVELSGGNTEYVRVECYGWFKTLEWRFYANATTSNVSTTTQISAIVTSAGQFFNGTLIENVSGIDSNQYRDGTVNALRQVLELMSAGTTADRPLLARTDKDRYLHIYQRQADEPEYLMRSDGQLETLLGQTVKPSHCIAAAWVRIKDIPDTLGGLSAMRNFFIESAEYDVERDRTLYRPAGAFEPVRLAKWLGIDTQDLGTGKSGGLPFFPGGTGAASPTSWLFTQPSTSTITSNTPDISSIIDSGGSAFGTSNLDTGRIDINETGVYWMTVHLPADSFSAGTGYKYMDVIIVGVDSVRDVYYQGADPTDTHKVPFGISVGFELAVTTYVQIQFSGVTSLMGSYYSLGNVDIMKLRDL